MIYVDCAPGEVTVRIPLDYYRILGLPLAASEDQLRQAYSDRRQQMPRREYSHAAITSRKQLIEEAYVVLSDPKERKAYDRLYLNHAYAPEGGHEGAIAVEDRVDDHQRGDRESLSIEIKPEELVGALLILQELGEYEQVLELGRPYLINRGQNHHNGHSGHADPAIIDTDVSEHPDIVLTVALACLELGREQWQQGNYENAAISLQTGEELLARENLFPNVQAEIRADLYRLRPYRILELVALPTEKVGDRQQGLQLLQEILDQRGGLDGSGQDYSGLNVDDFLRFIQQIRNHLTVAEQQKLFLAESKRPSAVATYLAVYALIAQGFSQRQPALIRQAKQMLLTLGKRQDVHLEQSLCALLLGQTEPASRALELSQEYEALAFIRENSQNSPDLLPGLCLYCERWLENDVFPHFRDLTSHKASLKEYFADPQVQSYLEALPNDSETAPPPSPSSTTTKVKTVDFNRDDRQTQSHHSGVNSPFPPELTELKPYRENSHRYPHPQSPSLQKNIPENPSQHQSRRQKPLSTNTYGTTSVMDAAPRPRRVKTRRRVTKRSSLVAKTKLLWMGLGSVAGLIVLWLLLSTTVGWLKNLFNPAPQLTGEQLNISLNQPPLELPQPDSQPQYPQGKLTQESAIDVVQAWLTAKSAALGPNHEVESLKTILTGSALKFWYNLAVQEKNANRYRQYSHEFVSLDNLEASDKDLDNAAVEATVKESANFYANDQQQNRSYNETVKVRYTLVRKEGTWLIREMSLLSNVSSN